jgi:CheY-like chemotaxis protein
VTSAVDSDCSGRRRRAGWQRRPDLLIVDLRLGAHELQGPDIVSLVRAHGELRHIPIIICSADAAAMQARAEEFLAAGDVLLLTKPFSLDQLEEFVGQGLRRRSSAPPLAATP